MIGLDTNILLRWMLNDDPVQSPAARRLLQSLDESRRGFVDILVMLEFFWVLRSRYKLPRTRLVGALRDLLEVKHLEFEAFETIGKALVSYERLAADFSDAVIAMRNSELGADKTLTFDEGAASRISSMELLA
ncbi:MAG: type II toxin-antitoxin system VapC family toxin [Hyphomicrobiales bacterium]|nr:type II toxin-antitoxin system VapC family toxin [Hyphomicrobiales bacterium]